MNLVIAPFSNQEGEWFWNDPDMREILKESNLYMIGQRRQIFFKRFRQFIDNQDVLVFDLECGDLVANEVVLPLDQFFSNQDIELFSELGPQAIKFYTRREDTEEWDLVHWFTPDRLLYYMWHEEVEVSMIENYRDFTEFSLYYVGISTKGDSFSRLFKTAHEKRSRILGNETQIKPDARLTDELMLFLFKVEDIQIHTIECEDDNLGEISDSFMKGFPSTPAMMAKDAEKAFIKVMQCKYNEVRYIGYPKNGSSEIGKFGYDCYIFCINEDITLNTESENIFGHNMAFSGAGWRPDGIIIRDDGIELLKSSDLDHPNEIHKNRHSS